MENDEAVHMVHQAGEFETIRKLKGDFVNILN